MPIINREFDQSEQRFVLQADQGLTGVSLIIPLVQAPYNMNVDSINVQAYGLSGSPTWNVTIDRFITGVGATTISGGWTTLTISAQSTSGMITFVQAAAGSTLTQLQSKDVLKIVTSGANTAIAAGCITAVLKCLQDVKSYFGTSVT